MSKILNKVKKHRERKRLLKVYTQKHGEMLEAYNKMIESYL